MKEAATARGTAEINSRLDDGRAELEEAPPDGEQAIAAATPHDLLLQSRSAQLPASAAPTAGLRQNPFAETVQAGNLVHARQSPLGGHALPWSLIALAAVVALGLLWWRRTR
jgi:hypothetical protein